MAIRHLHGLHLVLRHMPHDVLVVHLRYLYNPLDILDHGLDLSLLHLLDDRLLDVLDVLPHLGLRHVNHLHLVVDNRNLNMPLAVLDPLLPDVVLNLLVLNHGPVLNDLDNRDGLRHLDNPLALLHHGDLDLADHLLDLVVDHLLHHRLILDLGDLHLLRHPVELRHLPVFLVDLRHRLGDLHHDLLNLDFRYLNDLRDRLDVGHVHKPLNDLHPGDLNRLEPVVGAERRVGQSPQVDLAIRGRGHGHAGSADLVALGRRQGRRVAIASRRRRAPVLTKGREARGGPCQGR
mmetsp:Transcript_41562/g.93774  ORF Transcript_41562/g.93774 Transcript_41562/m.93774 type:complete len:291 (+) Transcript_41562:547-1419(+)